MTAKNRKTKHKRKSRNKTKRGFFKGLFDLIVKIIKFIFNLIKKIILGIIWVFKKIFNLIKKGFQKIILFSKERKKNKNFDDDLNEEQESDDIENNSKTIRESKFQVLDVIEGNIIKFERNLKNNKSTIGIILGARGQGKSALGMRLLENIYSSTKRPCTAMGFESKALPSWIKVVENVDDIPNGSFVLIDEGGILFSSRDSMSNANKMLSSLLLIARHKDISIVFISQNSSNLELNILRQADYLLLKPSSLMQIDFERKKIQQMYKEVSDKFDTYHSIRGLTYIYSDLFRGFVSNDLPSFWNDDVSKSFK